MTTYEPEADVERAWKAWDDMTAEIATLRARLEEAEKLLKAALIISARRGRLNELWMTEAREALGLPPVTALAPDDSGGASQAASLSVEEPKP